MAILNSSVVPDGRLYSLNKQTKFALRMVVLFYKSFLNKANMDDRDRSRLSHPQGHSVRP